MSIPSEERLPLRIKVGHAFGSVAYGVKDNGFGVLLMLFYNQVLGLDAGIVGLILLCALLMDALIDPLVGHFSDRTRTRFGKRHPWLYAAILPMAASWTMLWFPPIGAGAGLYFYLFLFAFLMRASISCYEVPALSVVPALTADYDERTSVTRWRLLFAWAGGLVTLVMAFAVFLVPEPGYPVGTLNVNGYQRYGLFGAGAIIVATLVSSLTTHKRLAHWPEDAPSQLGIKETFAQIRETLSNRAYLILLASTFFSFASHGLTLSISAYLLAHFWEMPQAGFIAYSISLFVGVVLALILLGLMQNRIEKQTGACIAILLAVAVGIVPYGLRALEAFPENGTPLLIPALFTLLAIATGFATIAMTLKQSMAADVVEQSQEATGRRSEGLFFSGYFFVQKCTTGVGLALTGLIISLSGFPDRAKPGMVAAPILNNLAFYYLIVIIFCALASAIIISRFPITRAEHHARVRELATRKAALGG
jgi:glycoside/pentoside/hexuronide:cation symporter, GPH family